jgi:septum formation inhibitor-activating ATPase MinD
MATPDEFENKLYMFFAGQRKQRGTIRLTGYTMVVYQLSKASEWVSCRKPAADAGIQSGYGSVS